MSAQLNGRSVLFLLRKDMNFSLFSANLWSELEPFILALPDLLGDLLSQQASVENIMRARIIFLENCLTNNYVSKVLEVLPPVVFSLFRQAELRPILIQRIKLEITFAHDVISHITSYRKRHGEPSDQFLINRFGLDATTEVYELIKRGELTIAQLLLVEPSVICRLN